MATKKAATTKRPAKKKAAKKAPAKRTAKKATAKKPAKKAATAKRRVGGRDVYAVSPLRGMSLETWIAEHTSGWQTEVIRRIAAVVAKAAPGSSATIKWRMPIFEANGAFAFVRAAKAHVTVGFWRSDELEAPVAGFESGGRMGHFKVHGPGELDEKGLAVMVKSAVKLNRDKGPPAMGGRA